MSQNFNFENGIVGKYKGIQVEVISYSKYKKMPSPQSNIIYAISTGSDQNLVLVLKDTCIGYMTPTGEITEERPHPFGGKKPEKKVEEPKKEEVKEEKEIDLKAMSKPIDQYIKNALDRDWSKEFEATWKKEDRKG